MARFRSIDPAVWPNPKLRRLGMVGRQVFLYLVTCLADDEGRFTCDHMTVWEGAFSRSDPVSEEDVLAALTALEDLGLLLRYGEGLEYGFLTGWYEHQSIRRHLRSPSAVPAPPVHIDCWVTADQIRSRYAAHIEAKADNVSWRDAVRWFLALPETLTEVAAQQLRTTGAATAQEVRPEGKGGEVEGKGSTTSREQHAPPDGDAPLVEKKTREPEADTPTQAAIREAWQAFGFSETPDKGLSREDASKAYGRMSQLVVEAEAGPDTVLAWARQVRVSKKPKPPDTLTTQKAKVRWFAARLRNAVNRPWEWDPGAKRSRTSPTYVAADDLPESIKAAQQKQKEWEEELLRIPG